MSKNSQLYTFKNRLFTMNFWLTSIFSSFLLFLGCSNISSAPGTSETSPSEEPFTELITQLFPVDTKTATDNSGNVIQGLSSFGDNWLVSQDAGNGYILFNLLNSNGVSIGNWQVSNDSHGQDLSWDGSGNSIQLFSGNPYEGTFARDAGITVFTLNLGADTVTHSTEYDLLPGYKSSTPTLNTDKTKFALRTTDNNDPFNDRVYIYDRASVESGSTLHESFFVLDSRQTVPEQYFQGIVFDDDKIFALTGDNSLTTDKLLFTYDLSGNVLDTKTITAGKFIASLEGDIWEPEGLTLKEGSLYFTINSGIPGYRIKRLYRIK